MSVTLSTCFLLCSIDPYILRLLMSVTLSTCFLLCSIDPLPPTPVGKIGTFTFFCDYALANITHGTTLCNVRQLFLLTLSAVSLVAATAGQLAGLSTTDDLSYRLMDNMLAMYSY